MRAQLLADMKPERRARDDGVLDAQTLAYLKGSMARYAADYALTLSRFASGIATARDVSVAYEDYASRVASYNGILSRSSK
jgi:hypothetical protein